MGKDMGVFKVKAVVLLPKLLYTNNCIHNHMLITRFLWLLWRKSLAIDIFMIVICNTRVAENVGGKNISEFSCLDYLEKKTLANGLQIKYGY